MEKRSIMGGGARVRALVTLIVTAGTATGCLDIDEERTPEQQTSPNMPVPGNPTSPNDDSAQSDEGSGTLSEAINGSLTAMGIGFASPFSLVNMYPPPYTKIATPRSAVTLTFSKTVDPATVNQQSVMLRERESQRLVPIALVVSGAIVTATPLRPLNTNYRYTVELDDVGGADPDDDTVDFNTRFYTQTNFHSLYLRYTNATPVRAHVYNWSPNTGVLLVNHFVSGPDGLLQTADDFNDLRVELQYDINQDNTLSHVRGNPGPDNVFDTADDVHFYERRMLYSALGPATRQHIYFGPDGLVGTADDTSTLETYYYDGGDRYAGSCTGTSCTIREYVGDEVHQVTSVDPGSDGLWRTADDVLDPIWSRGFFDQYGVQLGWEVHELASDGSTTVTSTSMQGYTDYIVANGLATEAFVYTEAGADGIWRTADDVGTSRYFNTFDAEGFLETSQTIHAGPDGLLGTADDALYENFDY